MKDALFVVLLKNRGRFWERLRAGETGWSDLASLCLFTVLSTGAYGVVLAGWRAPLLSLYVAVKLPLLFLATTAVVSVLNWMLAVVLGSGLSFRSTVLVVFASMTVGGWILLALAPVAFFFVTTGVPYAGSNEELRYAHNAILMTHIAILALAGVAGNAALLSGLRRTVRPGCPVFPLFFAWLGAFAFVGCQMSWMLRPFVGSPFYPVAFLRPDWLDRNFYEFVFTEVLPFLLTGRG